MQRNWGFLGAALVPTFRSSSYFSAHTGSELRKVMGTSKSMIPVPPFHLKFLNGICRLWCRNFKWAALALAFAGFAQSAFAQSGEIKIGEINSYSLLPAFTEPYRKGWQLAVEQINAPGGVNGRKITVISKDDGGKPADALTAANELVSSDNVVMLSGTFLSNIGLAVSDFAKQKKVFFLAAEPLTDAIT